MFPSGFSVQGGPLSSERKGAGSGAPPAHCSRAAGAAVPCTCLSSSWDARALGSSPRARAVPLRCAAEHRQGGCQALAPHRSEGGAAATATDVLGQCIDWQSVGTAGAPVRACPRPARRRNASMKRRALRRRAGRPTTTAGACTPPFRPVPTTTTPCTHRRGGARSARGAACTHRGQMRRWKRGSNGCTAEAHRVCGGNKTRARVPAEAQRRRAAEPQSRRAAQPQSQCIVPQRRKGVSRSSAQRQRNAPQTAAQPQKRLRPTPPASARAVQWAHQSPSSPSLKRPHGRTRARGTSPSSSLPAS